MSRVRVWALAALLVLNGGVFGAFTLPRLLQSRTMDERTATLRQEVERGRSRLAALKERSDIVRENRRDEQRFYSSIVKTPEESMLPTIRFVEHAASEAGLTNKTGPSWTKTSVKTLGIVQFGMTMPLSGPYPQIVDFLGRLERAPLFLVVDDVQLKAHDNTGELAFHLSTYFKGGDGKGPDGT